MEMNVFDRTRLVETFYIRVKAAVYTMRTVSLRDSAAITNDEEREAWRREVDDAWKATVGKILGAADSLRASAEAALDEEPEDDMIPF